LNRPPDYEAKYYILIAIIKTHNTLNINNNFSSNKCCADTENVTPNANEHLHSIKSQCVQEMKKIKKAHKSHNSTTDSEGGLYNLFSCDRLNRWKATITCTMNCMGQKLEMVLKNVCDKKLMIVYKM